METVVLKPYVFEKLNITQLLSTIIYMRSTNSIPDTIFTLNPTDTSNRKRKVFTGIHQVPPMLKLIIKKKSIPMLETVNYENLPKSFTVVSETQTDPNSVPYMRTESFYSVVESGGVECRTQIHLKLFKTKLPKFMRKQFETVANNKASRFRKIETQIALENF